jgi:putative DNA primase/helicase
MDYRITGGSENNTRRIVFAEMDFDQGEGAAMDDPLQEIARTCGGPTRTSAGFLCRCPAHEDRMPSLSLGYGDQGKILVHCFAGCDPISVIAALQARNLWSMRPIGGRPFAPATKKLIARDTARTTTALHVWADAQSGRRSLVEVYFARRGLIVPVPPSVRLHLGLKHPTGGVWPTMVALVTGGVDEKPIAIHRTFLAKNGTSKAPVQPTKLMLGPCAGAVVRLGGQGRTLLVGEGIETCLSALQATGYRTWAALSTSGLRRLNLPDGERDIIILADADDQGEAAAKEAARRWVREGRRVRIARPPLGMDFNDLLTDRAPRIEGGAT